MTATGPQIRKAMPLAVEFINAFTSDANGEGHDIESGLIGPAVTEFLVKMSERVEQAPDQLKGGSWEENVKTLLNDCPFTRRDMSGDLSGLRGRESLMGSLVLTFMGMQSELKALKK